MSRTSICHYFYGQPLDLADYNREALEQAAAARDLLFKVLDNEPDRQYIVTFPGYSYELHHWGGLVTYEPAPVPRDPPEPKQLAAYAEFFELLGVAPRPPAWQWCIVTH